MQKGLRLLSFIVVCLQLANALSNRSPHQHHHKRSSLIEFESDPMNTVRDATTFYYPVGTPFVKLTCTIKSASLLIRLNLFKENITSTNETLKTDIMDTYQYVINPKLETSRFSVVPSETYQDNVAYLKITFTIKDLRLADNGLYRCLYNHSYKDIKLEVYKPINTKDISMTYVANNATRDGSKNKTDLTLSQTYAFLCKVTDIYPKPTVTFQVNGLDVKNVDESHVITEPFHYSVTANFSAYALQSNNFQAFSCVVRPNIPSLPNVSKTTILHVHGIDFNENECPTTVAVSVGEKNVTIACKFFAYPKPSINWSSKDPSDVDAEENTVHDEDIINKVEGENRDFYRSSVFISEIVSIADLKTYKLQLSYPHKTDVREIRLVAKDSLEAKNLLESSGSNDTKAFRLAIFLSNLIALGLFFKL